VSAGLEKVSEQAKFIADIYQLLPSSCIFIINSEEEQQGENKFCIIYISCLLLVKKNVLIKSWRGYS
jgi:hypothetical protein